METTTPEKHNNNKKKSGELIWDAGWSSIAESNNFFSHSRVGESDVCDFPSPPPLRHGANLSKHSNAPFARTLRGWGRRRDREMLLLITFNCWNLFLLLCCLRLYSEWDFFALVICLGVGRTRKPFCNLGALFYVNPCVVLEFLMFARVVNWLVWVNNFFFVFRRQSDVTFLAQFSDL